MKMQAFAAALCLSSALAPVCIAQTVIRPVQAQNSAQSQKQPDPTPPHVVIERPVPEDQDSIAPKPIPHADTDADQAIRKQADAAITQRASDVSDDCDAHFDARIDWTRISAQDIHLAMPENTCGAVLDALEEYCQTSAGRERVSQSIKGVICTAGGPTALSIHAGTLLYTLDWQSANPAAYVYSWLASHL